MPVAASAIYFLNLRGDVLINRLYRDDIGENMVDAFRTHIMQTKELGTCPVRQIGGCSYLYMRISNIYIVIVVSSNANVACAFEFVVEAVSLFKSYFGGTFDEDAIRNNSVLIYELLDEIMDFGYPQNLSPEILKLYITQGVRSPFSSKLVRPHLSRGDGMWCLLMSDLHVGRASSIEIPVIPLNIGNKGLSTGAALSGSVESLTGRGVVAPALCRFHGGWGFGNGGGLEFPVSGFSSCGMEMTLQREIEGPKRFNLSPSMKSLKRNVTMFAAGFRANSKQLQPQSQTWQIALSPGNANIVLGAEAPVQKSEESLGMKNQEIVNSVLSKFRELKLEENWVSVAEDQMDEMIVALLHQVKDLERQVKDRKEWAHEKAMQAARKLCHDLTELKMLRMEQEETQRLKKGKQTLEDTTMKRLSEMESALRKASGQVDRSNAAVRRLETENAEIRAEMEASKLSASESVRTCLEAAKREKKYLKKLLAWEKQKAKLHEEIADEKEKILELQQHVVRIKQSQKEVELKWRQEVKAKEVVFTQVEEERQSKELAEASTKRKLETLRLKIEIDFQRHKDDLQRLEQELSRLKVSAQFTELNHPSNTLSTAHNEGAKPRGETITKLLHDVYGLEDPSDKEINCDRECMICMKEEVSIVFLPCAHQVLCANCSDSYGKKGRATCPCCRVPIEQRIRVYGASS